MNRFLIKLTCAFLVVMSCVSCTKQPQLTVSQTFILSNETEQTWDAEITVKWRKKYPTHRDSTMFHLEKSQTDSVEMYFELTDRSYTRSAIAVTNSTVNEYYFRRGCWITTKLTNRETQQTYEWEQQLSPCVRDTLEGDSVMYPWVCISSSGPYYDQSDRFQCVIHP